MSDMSLVKILLDELDYSSLAPIGSSSGCISAAIGYRSNTDDEIFVKTNNKKGADTMFAGEYASLEAIYKTDTVICPKPIKVLRNKPAIGSVLITEYLHLIPSDNEATLAEAIAELHIHNWRLLDSRDPNAVKQFGFSVPTCCGFLPQQNTWRDTWVEFYSEKIDYQIDLTKDSTAEKLWKNIRPKIGSLFSGITVRPSLLHGDMWSGNVSATSGGPVVYDPASFYGHHEYEMGIAKMFGGFGKKFFDTYFSVIPKEADFEKRNALYQLFHYLNHWNHFGGGYRSQSMNILQSLYRSL